MSSWSQFFPRLPTTATGPFCPSEVQGSIQIDAKMPYWQKFLKFCGPGLLVSVGYMDPGNWATDIEAGSKFGYQLLFVVLLSSLAAIVLQCLSLKLGIVAQKDLARMSREHFPRQINWALWFLAEIAIIACDLAEVLGCALAFHLLIGVSLEWGLALTALDTLLILGLQGKGFRRLEAIVLALVATIAGCFFVEIVLLQPYWPDVARGLIPSKGAIENHDAWYLAIGILGATVMPHNLYLHSSVVQTRIITGDGEKAKREALSLSTIDTIGSLSIAFFVNAAILVVAGSAFHGNGHEAVSDISDAYHLLEPIVGTALGSLLFGIALLASGQSSTFTGTIAGQIIMDGYLNLKIPCWQRRIITRALALVPAFIGVVLLGGGAIGKLLVLSQVVLSLQLPFAIAPLILFTSRREIMGIFANSWPLKMTAWLLFGIITTANIWLLVQVVGGGSH
jgi:manganese transport protein